MDLETRLKVYTYTLIAQRSAVERVAGVFCSQTLSLRTGGETRRNLQIDEN